MASRFTAIVYGTPGSMSANQVMQPYSPTPHHSWDHFRSHSANVGLEWLEVVKLSRRYRFNARHPLQKRPTSASIRGDSGKTDSFDTFRALTHVSGRMLGEDLPRGMGAYRFQLEALEPRVLLSADGVLPEPAPSTDPALAADLANPSVPSPGGPLPSDVGFVEDLKPGTHEAPLEGLGTPKSSESTESTSPSSASRARTQTELHAVAGISDLVNPADSSTVMLAPGKVRWNVQTSGAGRAGLWKIVVPTDSNPNPMANLEFGLRGIVSVPTDGAVAWYDEGGNLLGIADVSGNQTVVREDSGLVSVEKGRTYLVGAFFNRAVPADAARLEVTVVDAITGTAVSIDPRTGLAGVVITDSRQVFQAPSDERWHPLRLLNAAFEARISVAPEVAGREVQIAIFRKVPASQQVAGSGPEASYTLVAEASSSGANAAEILLRAPSGATLSEQEYLLAVSPKGYATAAAGYRVDVRATTPLVAPAALSAAEVFPSQGFALRPTSERGWAEASFNGQAVAGDKARYFSFRAAADGRGVIRVDAGFDAVVALYSGDRALLAVATDASSQGVVELRATFEAGDLYYVRVVNGPGTAPRESNGFDIDLGMTTTPRELTLAAPAAASTGVDAGGFTISPSGTTSPSFFELQPATGIDVVTLIVLPPSNASIRISVASVDGFSEQTFAVAAPARLSVRITTQGAPLQVAVASTGGFGALLYYNALTVPREIPIGSLGGRTLSPGSGEAETTMTSFDRNGDRAGFEFYQGIVPSGQMGVWTAEGKDGATPVLLRYETTGSVLRLVDWVLADDTAQARLEFTVGSGKLYAIAAYQVARLNTPGSVRLTVDHPTPIPVAVGMVPDLVYEQQNQNPERFRYILQIRSVSLEKSYEEDYWETLLPDRFFNGGQSEDPASPLLEVTPDTPGSALRLIVTMLDGDGDPLKRWNGEELIPFRPGPDGVVRVDFATLGVLRQALEGKNLRFRVQAENGALGDGTYTLRLAVRTPNPHPYEITEPRWAYPGGGAIPAQVGAVSNFPAGTAIVDVPQNPSGEGSVIGSFASSSVGVRVYRFWTPSEGPFRAWTDGWGADPANTTIKLYRARYAVTGAGERNSWWETVDYLEELEGIGASLDWYPADRSEIDALVMIQDPAFPAYKQPTDVLGQSVVGNPPESQLQTPYLPADRQFSDLQDVYFVVVKNEQGSTGSYRLRVSTEDLPQFQRDPVFLPHRPTAAAMRSVLTVDVPGVELYGRRIGVYEVQMPERHSGYLGVSGQAGADWRFAVYGPDEQPLDLAVIVDGEFRYLVPPGGRVVTVKVLETGRNLNSNNGITLAATLLDDAGMPTNLSSLGLGGVAHLLLPTNPWGELDAGEFTGSAPIESSGRVFRFRAPAGTVRIDVAPLAGSVASFQWGIYDDGRLLAWDHAIPGQPATHTTTIAVGPSEIDSLSGSGRNLVLVVRHASGSVQPAQFSIVIAPEARSTFTIFDPSRSSTALPRLAFENGAELGLQNATRLIDGRENFTDWNPDQWVRFAVPDGPGQVVQLVNLPGGENIYPLRYDVFDATGRVRVATGTKTFSSPAGVIELPQLEGGKAYVLRLAPRDQPLAENLPLHVRFRPGKLAQVNGAYVHSVPSSSVSQPTGAERTHSNFRGDFSLTASLAGSTSKWWRIDVPKAGPATLKAVVEGSTRVRIAIYRDDGTGEFPQSSLVDFVNESSMVVTPDGKEFELTTFLGAGNYFIEVARTNTQGGQVQLVLSGPEYTIVRLTPDPNQGVVLRAEMGRATRTQFFDVIAPAGSFGPASFLAYDLDLLDGRPQTANSGSPPTSTVVELTLRARIQVWAVSDTPEGGLSLVLVKTLGREPAVDKEDPIKATLETPGTARPFQRYVIGIQIEGTAPGYQDEISARSKSIGVQAVFQVPNSGTPDLVVESLRLLPNSGRTLVEVTVLNRGYAVAFNSQSQFTYPTLEASQPVTALVAESILGPQTRRVRYLDWIDPVSPEDVTRYQVDAANELAEIDEANNQGQAAMKSVNAFRPVFSVNLSNGFDGNTEPGVWGRYLDSRQNNSVKVLTDIILEASDGDDAANTYDSNQEVYRLRSDSPLLYTSANHDLQDRKVMERVVISHLSPSGPGNPNLFTAYAVDRFGLRSDLVVRVIQVVPFPKWLEAGESEIVFNQDSREYELEFRAQPVDYAATLTQMLDANIPLVGDLQNQFSVEAIADRSFSLNPNVAIPPILPSIRAQTTILGQDILNKVFGPGTVQDHVSVLGHIDVRADTLEAGAFELTARFDQYPVDHWEGPEIPIFGFDAAIVSAAVQAQVIIDLKFDAAVTFAFDLTQTNAPLRITSPSFAGLDLRVELRFEGEVEVAGFLDIASVGGGFFFTLKPRYGLEDMDGSIPLENFLDEACLGLAATIGGNLSADVFGFEVFSIELESDEIQLTNCDVATSALAGATTLTGTTGTSADVARVGLQGAKPVLPNDKHIRYTQRILPGDALLPTPSTRPNPQLILDAATGERMLAYLDPPSAGAAPVLYVARGNASGFSAPMALPSSEWMSRPLLAATRDGTGLRAVVIYQTTPIPTATTTRNQFLSGQDLKYRYFDGTTWSEELTLTDNALLDWQATVSFNANGDGALAWIQKAVETPLDAKGWLTGSDRLYAARWDKVTHRWLAPTSVGSAGTHNQPSVAMGLDGVTALAWNQRASNDNRLGLARRATNGTWTVTTVADAALPAGGRPRNVAVGFESDGRIMVVTTYTQAPVKGEPMVTRVLARTGTFDDLRQQSRAFEVLARTGGVSSLQLVRAPDGTLVVGWHERRGDFSDAVVVRRQGDGTWSRPARATQSSGNERALRFAIDAKGAVLSVYERGVHYFRGPGGTLLPPDGQDLKAPALVSGLLGSGMAVRGPELSLVGPLMLDGLPGDERPLGLAGSTVEAQVLMRNSGDTTADALVTFYRDTPLNLGVRDVKLGERKIRLLPGGSLSVGVPVEVALGTNRFFVEVTLAGSRDAFSDRDNAVSGQITGQVDLAVETLSILETIAGQPPRTGGQIGLRFEIVNRSGVAYRGPVRVTTFWEDPSKPGVRTTVTSGVGDLEFAPGQRRALPGLFSFEAAGLRLIGVEIGDTNLPELSTANNRASLPLDLRPDLALEDVTVMVRGEVTRVIPAVSVQVMNFSGVNNAVVQVAITNVGSAPVRSFTLRLYHSVDGEPFREVAAISNNVLIQPGEHHVADFKVSALAGLNVYRAEVVIAPENLPAGLPEPVTSNNVAMTSVVLQGLPDLQVGSLSFSTPTGNPPTLRIGAAARLDVRVDNKGIAVAKGVLVEVFSQSRGQSGEGILLGSVTIDSIAALGAETVRITLNTTALPETADAVRVVIDRHQNLLERSDLNNTASRAILVAPPTFVAQQGFLNAGVGQLSQVGSLSIAFNRDLVLPRDPSVLRIQNLATGEFVDSTKYSVVLDAATRTVTWKFTGLEGAVLPAGNYVARIAAGALSDRASNALGRDFILRFTVTPGDANGDGVTNERDYLLLWRELRKAEATRNTALDLNGDGKVSQTDLELVRGNFGRRGAGPGVQP